MPKLLVLFNLKSGVNAAEYEAWAKTSDVPTVKALGSVDNFHVVRSKMILGSDAPAPYQYFEIIEVNDLEQFFADINTDAVQKGAAKFAEYAYNPMFIVTDDIA
jgi:REDY-like protein HapK